MIMFICTTSLKERKKFEEKNMSNRTPFTTNVLYSHTDIHQNILSSSMKEAYSLFVDT